MLRAVQIGIETLRANPVHTLLSTLGIVMGAASLVGVLSLGDGIEAFARRQIERQGLQSLSVLPQTSDTVDGLAVPRSRRRVEAWLLCRLDGAGHRHLRDPLWRTATRRPGHRGVRLTGGVRPRNRSGTIPVRR